MSVYLFQIRVYGWIWPFMRDNLQPICDICLTWLECRLTSKLRAWLTRLSSLITTSDSSCVNLLSSASVPWCQIYRSRSSSQPLHAVPEKPEVTDQWVQRDITHRRQRRNPQQPEPEILSARKPCEPFPGLLKTWGLVGWTLGKGEELLLGRNHQHQNYIFPPLFPWFTNSNLIWHLMSDRSHSLHFLIKVPEHLVYCPVAKWCNPCIILVIVFPADK